MKPHLLGPLSLAFSLALSVTGPAEACGDKGNIGGGARVTLPRGSVVTRATITLDDDDDGPVTAGPMSREAERARRLFEAERWVEAAPALGRVARGETGDDEGNQQIAPYRLGVALYQLGLFQASLDVFSAVAERPTHFGFEQTLLWLARLDAVLPEPAGLIERVGRYPAAQLARLDNPVLRDAYWRLNYLLGWHRYRSRDLEGAIGAFEQVGRASASYLKAQFMMGISYALMNKKVPAVKAFGRLVDAASEAPTVEEARRLRELAWISTGRAYYSGTVRLDDACVPTIDATRLSSSVKYWSKIDLGSELWPQAQLEQSWAYFMAGDYPHALGNLHSLESTYFAASLYPEADIVRALISLTTCQYDDVVTQVARMQRRYLPIRSALDALLKRLSAEARDERVLAFYEEVRAGKAVVPAIVRPIVETVLADRRIRHNLDYLRVLGEEEARFLRAPVGLRAPPLGDAIQGSLSVARSVALHNVAALVRQVYQRRLDEIDERLLDGSALLFDTALAVTVRERRRDPSSPEREREMTFAQVKPDDEHVIWPFDGEFWRDELGSYRQVVVSRCGL